MQWKNVSLRCLLSIAQLFENRLRAVHPGPLLWGTCFHKRNLVPVFVPFFRWLQHLFGIFCKDSQTIRDLHQAHAISEVCDYYF